MKKSEINVKVENKNCTAILIQIKFTIKIT